jgi:glycosyltransferase involved in cell wall biosynthesis
LSAIVIDARWLRTGIGRYTIALLQGLREQLGNASVTCITQPQYVGLVSAFCDRVIPCDAGIYGIQEQLALPWLARDAAALYAPHYNIPVLWKRPLLVTIHDLNHLLDATYRGTWKSRLYARPLLMAAARHADVIITPSEYTKAKLCEHLGADAAKITVVPCCVAPCFHPKERTEARRGVEQRLGITRPYLLFVGNCAPNKNVPLLLESLAMLRSRRSDSPLLVIAGGDCKWHSEMLDAARSLGVENQVAWLGELNDALLADLYAAALMTIMPSFEEGFGLPVIESMACGTPVICSQAASLPEVAGDAALFFSPHSCEQLTDAIERLMDSTTTRERLIRSGLTRSSLFSQQTFGQRQALAIRQLMAS